MLYFSLLPINRKTKHSTPAHLSLSLFFSDFTLRTMYARGTLLYKKKKKNGMERANGIFVLLNPEAVGFSSYAMKPEYVPVHSN